jgi:hypothetical protein
MLQLQDVLILLCVGGAVESFERDPEAPPPIAELDIVSGKG